MTATMQPTSLYQQLGGKEAIVAVVDEFYNRVVADERLAGMFGGLDMVRQRKHLAAFLAMAFGGPNEYQGRAIRAAHQGLGITGEQFGAVAGHLQATLVFFGVPGELIDTVIGTVAGLQGDVVGL
jgi:hemoglobin